MPSSRSSRDSLSSPSAPPLPPAALSAFFSSSASISASEPSEAGAAAAAAESSACDRAEERDRRPRVSADRSGSARLSSAYSALGSLQNALLLCCCPLCSPDLRLLERHSRLLRDELIDLLR